MSIVLVGGHDRLHSKYRGIGSKRGHKLKVYTQMPTKFNKVIGKPDAIVLFTSTVSHKMVGVAVKEAKKQGIPIVRSHNSSLGALKKSILQLESTEH